MHSKYVLFSSLQEYLEDTNEVSDFDDDEALFQEDKHDWKMSSLFLVKNCSKLAVKMNKNAGTFADALDGAAIIFEDITELDVVQFDAGRAGNGIDSSNGTVTKQLLFILQQFGI